MGGRGAGFYPAGRGRTRLTRMPLEVMRQSAPPAFSMTLNDGTKITYRRGPGNRVADATGLPQEHLSEYTYDELYERAQASGGKITAITKAELTAADARRVEEYKRKPDYELGIGTNDKTASRAAKKIRLQTRAQRRNRNAR